MSIENELLNSSVIYDIGEGKYELYIPSFINNGRSNKMTMVVIESENPPTSSDILEEIKKITK